MNMSAKSLKCGPSTGINILVVGSGIGGITTAIEALRKGASVKVLEKRDTFSTFGKHFRWTKNDLFEVSNLQSLQVLKRGATM